MRLVDVPHAHRAGLVHMRTEVRRVRDFLEGGCKLQVHWRRVHRVHAQHHQPLDLARQHVAHQRRQIGNLLTRHRVHRLGVNHRLAHRAQRLVQLVGGKVHRRRRLLARNRNAAAAARLQVLQQGRQEFARVTHILTRNRNKCVGRRDREPLWKRRRKRHQLARLQRQPMIRLEPGHGRHGLDGVHPVHGLACFVAMPLRIRRRHRQKSRMRDPAQEIRI